MEEDPGRGDGRAQLFHLIPNGRSWSAQDGGGGEKKTSHGVEEEKLELRLGLPGGEDRSVVQGKREHPVPSALSLGHVPKVPRSTNPNASSGTKRGFSSAIESEAHEASTERTSIHHKQQQLELGFLQLQAKGKQVLCRNMSAEKQILEGKACDPHPAHASSSKDASVVHNSPHSRASTAPVVGWPPLRSFRKNLASTAKTSTESPSERSEAAETYENSKKGLFVKINMDGIPIGRKIDLKAYGSYDKLSLAVDDLFRGLMTAQKEQPLTSIALKSGEEKHPMTTCLVVGKCDYTLVYEDEEGDRMLVGDVPWDMFVSTAKRIRVFKGSDLSASKFQLGPRNTNTPKRL